MLKEQSEINATIDESKAASIALSKNELNEQELEKVSGGFGFGGHFGGGFANLGSQGTGSATVTVLTVRRAGENP